VSVSQAGVISGPKECPMADPGGLSAENAMARSALALWRIDGTYYDLTPLLGAGRHPGGVLPLRQTHGSDASVLFRVQHLGSRPRAALEKYRVRGPVLHGDLVDAGPDFSFEPDGFYEQLKERVRRRLKERGLVGSPRKAGPLYLTKLGVNVALFAGSWLRVTFYPFSGLACLVNALSRLVLTGLGHDAIHGILMPDFPSLQSAYAQTSIRGFISHSADKWHKDHVTGHHPYTKTHLDPDEHLDQRLPFWRLTNATPWTPKHTWPLVSHVVPPMLAPVVLTLKQLPKIASLLAASRVEGACALAALVACHLLPLFFRPFRQGAAVVLLTSTFPSLVTVLAFQSSHLAEHLDVRAAPGVDWGEQQLRSSANFEAVFGIAATLDLQIEHHLFPMLSYENQRLIQPLVRQAAEEFGLPYHSYGSLGSAFFHHLAHMLTLGYNEPHAYLGA